MEQERNETYERIPWETLERQGGDRQRLVIGGAVLLVVAALAYSFMKGQPAPTPVTEAAPNSTAAVVDSATTTAAEVLAAPPVVVSEADLYAVDPERLLDEAAARAEWFAVEYFSFDGSTSSALDRMLPEGIPAPTAPEGVQVYVDWAGVLAVDEESAGHFRAEVVVRSLRSSDGTAFTRQEDHLLTVTLTVGEDGSIRVSRPPIVEVVEAGDPPGLESVQLPDDVREAAELEHGEVIAGIDAGKGWEVYVMATGPDGVSRPQAVLVP